jgi:hypothetical protein
MHQAADSTCLSISTCSLYTCNQLATMYIITHGIDRRHLLQRQPMLAVILCLHVVQPQDIGSDLARLSISLWSPERSTKGINTSA